MFFGFAKLCENAKCTKFFEIVKMWVLPDGKSSGGTHPLEIPALRAAALEVPALRHFYSFKGGNAPKTNVLLQFSKLVPVVQSVTMFKNTRKSLYFATIEWTVSLTVDFWTKISHDALNSKLQRGHFQRTGEGFGSDQSPFGRAIGIGLHGVFIEESSDRLRAPTIYGLGARFETI